MQCKQGQVSVEKQGLNIIFPVVSQSFLYRCVGVMLQECHNKEVVKKQLQEILLTARHSDAIEREVQPIPLTARTDLYGTGCIPLTYTTGCSSLTYTTGCSSLTYTTDLYKTG